MKYHVTCLRNERQIRTGRGIDPAYAKGKRAYSWFVSGKDLQWAFLHCQLRHGWDIDEIIALPVDMPDSAFSEHARQGLFFRKELTPNSVIGPHVRPEQLVMDSVDDDEQWGRDMDAEEARIKGK